MKKTLLTMAAGMALLAFGACSGNKTCDNEKGCCKDGDRKEMYSGILPAADADGIRYSLELEFDDDDNYQKGDYDLVETYLKADSTANLGVADLKSFKSEGDFTVIKGEGADASKTYLKLVQDTKDSDQGSNSGPLYFYVENDSTLVLVGADLQPAASGLNYSLKRVK